VADGYQFLCAIVDDNKARAVSWIHHYLSMEALYKNSSGGAVKSPNPISTGNTNAKNYFAEK
jgi:hypothetical protein